MSTPTSLPIQQKAVLVSLRISGWSGRKQDKQATRELTERANAKPEAARVLKQLVSKERLADLNDLRSEMREEHFSLTMPWDDGERRLLPINVLDEYRRRIDALAEKRQAARDEFVDDYEDAVTEAETTLGDLFRREDYPDAGDIRLKISSEYDIVPVPDGSHFVANLGAEEAERLKQDLERRTAAKLTRAVSNLYSRIGKAVTIVADRIRPRDDDAPTQRLHKSLLDTLVGLAETLPDLNVTEDAQLRDACDTVIKTLRDVEVDMLRPTSRKYDSAKHQAVSATMDELKVRFAGYVGDDA